jgi:hypothetical protein
MTPVKKIKRVLKVGLDSSSSLSSFVERPVPTDKEVEVFERVMDREVREQEIDSNLDEIYSDKKGGRVDVKTMKFKKQPMWLIRIFYRLLILGLLALVGYLAYFYGFSNSNDISSLDFSITAPDTAIAGAPVSYQVTYHNPTKYPFTKLHLDLQYPNNFIYQSSSLPSTSGNASWELPDLAPGANVSLTVSGQIIAEPNSANVIFGHLSYQPSGLTSEFKKDASASTIISGPGFNVDLNYSATSFLNQNNDMTLVFSEVQNNAFGDFNINFSLPNNTNASVATTTSASSTLATTSPIATSTPAASSTPLSITKVGGTSWRVSGLTPASGPQKIPLIYKVQKNSNNPTITVQLVKQLDNGQSYIFWEKSFQPQLITSDLNLALTLNGSPNDGAINFGQTLNYSLTYNNRGGNTFKDVVIMAALNGDFLNWNSLQDLNNGQAQNQAIVWTKNEIPGLAIIKPADSGTINFSIKLFPFALGDLGKSMSVVSYGQYSINNQMVSGDSSKSNTINSQLNSDATLKEQILYFDTNNVPVGSGPLPPQAGQTTSFKVYWTVSNSLHELSDSRVVLSLPSYVSWNNNNSTNVGNLYYDDASHSVIWEIGRLPVSVGSVSASFGISVTPTPADHNKILVLSPGSTLSAIDTVTTATITKTGSAKTTKLEDDSIAGLNNSGIVQ